MTYRALSWNPNEVIAGNKLDTITNNMDHLYNYTPRARYTLPSGLNREQGVKIIAGRVTIAPQKTDNGTANVNYNGYFTVGCQPIITTAVISNWMPKTFCTISGIGQIVPDHTGFRVFINVASDIKKNDRVSKTTYVSWIAMGY